MYKKLFLHFLLSVFLGLSIHFITEEIESLNPIKNAIVDISFSDLYFASSQKKVSDDIFIVDIGAKNSETTRKEIANFIQFVNEKYKPSVIAVDVLFDSQSKNDSVNNFLTEQLNSKNVIKIFKVNKEYKFPYYSSLPGLKFNDDGYTFSLGEVLKNPCIRYYKPFIKLDSTRYFHFSKKVAEKFLNKNLESEVNFNKKMMINYNVDFNKNIIDINDTINFSKLKNKIVFVGISKLNKNGFPLFTEDTHFTPVNQTFIGRSKPDMYGISILATITSNLINYESISYNGIVSTILNILVIVFLYTSLFLFFFKYNHVYLFFKLILQTLGVLFLIMISLGFIYYTNKYIDLSFAILVMLFLPELVKINHKILSKISFYNE